MSILLSLLEEPLFELLKLFKNLKNGVFDRTLSRTHTCKTINLLKSDLIYDRNFHRTSEMLREPGISVCTKVFFKGSELFV